APCVRRRQRWVRPAQLADLDAPDPEPGAPGSPPLADAQRDRRGHEVERLERCGHRGRDRPNATAGGDAEPESNAQLRPDVAARDEPAQPDRHHELADAAVQRDAYGITL